MGSPHDMYQEGSNDERIDLVAYLYARTNRTGAYVYTRQQDLAGVIGISVSLLSKHLKDARQKNLLRESREYLGEQRERFSAQLGDQPVLLEHLQKLSGTRGQPVLQSFQVVEPIYTAATDDNSALAIGRGSAHAVATLLRGVRLVGLTFGMTVRGLVMELANRQLLTQRISNVIPLVPEPLGLPFSSLELSSSVIAERLRLAIAEQGAPAHSLLGIPCALSVELVADAEQVARENIRRWICNIKAYSDIFDERVGLINHLDTIITSVGIPRLEPEFPFHRIIDRALMIDHSAIGDFGGLLLTERNEQAENKYETLWLGARRRIYADVARRTAGRSDRCGGVIVVAAGASKVAPIMEIVRRDWVNHLIVDDSLASALESRIHRDSR